ncbi:2-oxo-4-hydroxy-4-carboxy-5-ureidoimidazoline decarboxylase [Brenneria rubrifaciens]|uniref:2-oxo-4-hydroxy-4-carboxy-5-ureidoimidazoline decarboxylase n=1 Tax=Brenneria rubrifaciens TaxID=55213 RepID=UPI001586A139|nr:2-oxo-4-hydroxy-4-carboxy-5-ureidoimidazoline decarboxylase [Brenneria rubrifaciens]
MITLDHFNQLDAAQAAALLWPCVALPDWTARVVSGRPYPDRAALLAAADQACAGWQCGDLDRALSAHPRIGEKPQGVTAHARLSHQEQAGVTPAQDDVLLALQAGNARYEATFGRIFLIRASGRGADEILQELQRRLRHSEQQEIQEALAQLRQITLLRLEGIIQP